MIRNPQLWNNFKRSQDRIPLDIYFNHECSNIVSVPTLRVQYPLVIIVSERIITAAWAPVVLDNIFGEIRTL